MSAASSFCCARCTFQAGKERYYYYLYTHQCSVVMHLIDAICDDVSPAPPPPRLTAKCVHSNGLFIITLYYCKMHMGHVCVCGVFSLNVRAMHFVWWWLRCVQLPIKRNCVFAKHHHHGVDPIRPNDDGRPLRARGPLIPLPYTTAAVISIAHRPYMRGAYTFSFSHMMREFSLDIYSERPRIYIHSRGDDGCHLFSAFAKVTTQRAPPCVRTPRPFTHSFAAHPNHAWTQHMRARCDASRVNTKAIYRIANVYVARSNILHAWMWTQAGLRYERAHTHHHNICIWVMGFCAFVVGASRVHQSVRVAHTALMDDDDVHRA